MELIEKADKIESLIKEKINTSYILSQGENPDPMELDKLDIEISSLNASVGQIWREFEGLANKWKQHSDGLKEVSRGLRRMHETLVEELKMTRR